jgi:hypothetical protein
MFQIIIKWKYYKDKSWFCLDKARRKKEMVWFVYRDKYSDYIINHMSYSDLQKLRLNIYNKYYKEVKFTPFSESDINGNVFTWYDVESPIIEIDNTDLAKLIPNKDYRKRFYSWDSVREKYYFTSEFINYVNLNVI